jgi:hypothetical protein
MAMLAMKRVPRSFDVRGLAAGKLESFDRGVRGNRYVIRPRRSAGATSVTSRDDLRAPIKVGFDVAQGSVTNAVV